MPFDLLETRRSTYLDLNYPINLYCLVTCTEPNSLTTDFKLSDDQLAGLSYALSKLDYRKQEILMLRYQEKQTYTEIGEKYYLSRERVRQIETRALRILKNTELAQYIRYGIMGVQKQKVQTARETGYEEGYRDAIREHSLNPPERGKMDTRLIPLSAISMSAHTSYCLSSAGCSNLWDVERMTCEEILAVRRLGKMGMHGVLRILQTFGIHHTDWEKAIEMKK